MSDGPKPEPPPRSGPIMDPVENSTESPARPLSSGKDDTLVAVVPPEQKDLPITSEKYRYLAEPQDSRITSFGLMCIV